MLGKWRESARGKSLGKSTKAIFEQQIWLKILIGLVLGFFVGLALSPSGGALVSEALAFTIGEWLKIPGVFFLGLLQMIIIPLVICSIILGISTSGELAFLKKISLRIIPYFILTTCLSITIGIFLVQTIKPGLSIDPVLVEGLSESASDIPVKTFEDLTIPERISNLIPVNYTQASLEKNMLQIVIFALILGIAILTIPKETAKPFKDLCVFGQVISMRVISWAMVVAPYAVFGLIADVTIRIGFETFSGVAIYMLTLLAGLGLMLCVYILIALIIGRQNPLAFLKAIRDVQVLAFSTSSSAAVMPLSIKAAEERLNIREEISRITIPLGVTINMDGTAMYQAVAALFLCQIFGIDLSTPEILLLLVTTVGASIGTPGTPGVGLVVLATILAGIGVPAAGIGIILGVDRILDMCRTVVNVTGDLTAASVMNRIVKH